jgi:hypothetical protein
MAVLRDLKACYESWENTESGGIVVLEGRIVVFATCFVFTAG